MKVRQATINDLDQLASLFDKYRIFYRKSSNYEAAKSFLKERIEQKESIIYIVENENNDLLGFTQLFPSFSSTRMKRLWILNDLYVIEHMRGQGLSKLLINRCKEHCINSNACGISLETEQTNHIGNQLYNSTDFRLEGNNFYFWTNPQ